MIYEQRCQEEKNLLNPSFCAVLLWHASLNHELADGQKLAIEEAFLVLPFVLDGEIRTSLPTSTRTSLPVWLDRNPLFCKRIVDRTQLLVPFTREGLLFSGIHDFIRFEECKLHANTKYRKAVNSFLKITSIEVKDSIKRASFIGKWFAVTGNATTVLALLGVQP